jgi:hypothetical protein
VTAYSIEYAVFVGLLWKLLPMETVQNNNTRPHFSRTLIVKAPGLLPMLYTPSELAEVMCVAAFTVREWVKWGLPHTRDETGHIWISGTDFSAWVANNRPIHKAGRLAPDQAYCLRCRKAVELTEITRSPRNMHVIISGTCPVCGCKINRGGRHDQ